MNNCMFMGRFTAEPELKETSTGLKVIKFILAIDGGKKKDTNEKITDFINFQAWNKTAKLIAEHFNKGNLILIDRSRFKTDTYEKDGVKMYYSYFVVDSFKFIPGANKKNDVPLF